MAKQVNKSTLKCNVPKKTPSHPTKSHIVKACDNGIEKIIRFGQQGVSGSPFKKENQKKIKNAEQRLEPDTQKILQKVSSQQLTGLIKSNGN